MAGDWIKFQAATLDKPEVHAIAGDLRISPEAVIGHLLRVWVWADQQSLNGHALSVTLVTLDAVSRCDGFAKAMKKFGWLHGDDMDISLPNFDRHNGKSAKNRALATERKQNERSRLNRDENTTREEKRRVKEKNTTCSKRKRFSKPTPEDLRQYCETNGMNGQAIACIPDFLDFYESKGWLVGNTPMKSWPHAFSRWIRTNEKRPQTHPAANSGSRAKRVADRLDEIARRSLAENPDA